MIGATPGWCGFFLGFVSCFRSSGELDRERGGKQQVRSLGSVELRLYRACSDLSTAAEWQWSSHSREMGGEASPSETMDPAVDC